ncbi:substrate-binding domain-containing protein [Actinotalea sp. M2MS4P-6]|uniref:sugar ABC transporter substrate-binding protein n=1 Tax=Actinotalea sp. M2MS4P-6 TaxID=2983762 RepID=UPI0021E51137|nr:substrate-binding domain-containing protein [Actinotalea sp. M2MS4P-6]MCV2396521.1 substrate-binding domain-containing protein [Actinotalea sp. M2MS4P-6]
MSRRRLVSTAAVLAVSGLALTACSSSSSGGSSSSTSSSMSESPSMSASAPAIDAGSFTADFSVMKQLTDLAAQGSGLVGVLLPDTTTSTRYVQYDAPYLKQAFEAAGLSADQFKIDNANGSASTMQTQAEADINAGASVLLVDPLDPGSGAAIENAAKDAGVAVIDYDRLVTGGPADRYYVSFDNVKVGTLIGQGFVQCVQDWGVQSPQVLIMDGDPTDNNATLFAQGYTDVLKTEFDNGTYTKVAEPAGTWDPQTAATTFEQQLTAHPEINAAITPNDDNANAVISILKSNGVAAKTFPTTGQDASLPGLQNVLTGYQCGTVYKPIYLEAQAAAALAIYLRAGVTPPDSLVNSTTTDTTLNADIPSVYTTPIWVTPSNMADTVVKDGAVTVADLCAGDVAQACTDAGIS